MIDIDTPNEVYEKARLQDFNWVTPEIVSGICPPESEEMVFIEALGGWKCYIWDDNGIERLANVHFSPAPQPKPKSRKGLCIVLTIVMVLELVLIAFWQPGLLRSGRKESVGGSGLDISNAAKPGKAQKSGSKGSRVLMIDISNPSASGISLIYRERSSDKASDKDWRKFAVEKINRMS
ncbi:MAG: hypothetical protein J5943_12115 [Oribacterium sp.]|nr:hypothetical protein [Oribacterium sp.]MBO6310253.1 hypothetical protein [Oribacterium sp.]MBP3802383.1 hypothetical protein [Oribacterium sp.]